MSSTETRCGYVLADVRKSLIMALERRNKSAAMRWAAELVVTPKAIGSLWASYWIGWAVSQSGPAIPILIRQGWGSIEESVYALNGDWVAIRNDTEVRRQVTTMTYRLLDQPRTSPVVWPSKEIVQHDIADMRAPDAPVPKATDGAVVLSVWQRIDDAMELRMMAGRFIAALEAGELRGALSVVFWTLLPFAQQKLSLPLKCAERGPPSLPAKIRASPLWFWLALGGAWLLSRRSTVHPGWITMHDAVYTAFRDHYKRWTPGDRMKMLLAWILQLRASCLPTPGDIWTPKSPPEFSLGVIDEPYKEIAIELTTPACIEREEVAKSKKTLTEMKMDEADARIMAALGIEMDE